VPAELHANRMQWLTRLCVIRCYVSVMWRPGVHRSVWIRCRAFRISVIYQNICVGDYRYANSDYYVVVVVVVWGPESGCTATCRLIVHTPCASMFPLSTPEAPRHNDAGDPSSERWNILGEKLPVIWPKVTSSTLL
jgi:hypothetical protein